MGGAAVLHPALDPARSCTKAGPRRALKKLKDSELVLKLYNIVDFVEEQ